jgi:hypothetical protein
MDVLDEELTEPDAFLVDKGIPREGREEFSEHPGNVRDDPSFRGESRGYVALAREKN